MTKTNLIPETLKQKNKSKENNKGHNHGIIKELLEKYKPKKEYLPIEYLSKNQSLVKYPK
tara:strand:- start:353 stop:532 length:180 start_codon:yes stop_codon:yes gene_type:complete